MMLMTSPGPTQMRLTVHFTILNCTVMHLLCMQDRDACPGHGTCTT